MLMVSIMLIDNLNINYEYYDNKSKTTLVFLHGWGQNIEMMKPVAIPFLKKYNCLLIDLPGHGKSDEPKNVLIVEDFVIILDKILKQLKIKNPVLIGHSFGGKLSLLYASRYKVKQLILFASPFKKEIQKLSFKTRLLKTLNKVPLLNKLAPLAKKMIGSADYRNSSEIMRKTLVDTVNLDIEEDVKKIKCPTILIWGTNDLAVNIKRAEELEKLINDCALIVYPNMTHYAYLEDRVKTISIMESFLK